MEKVFLAIIFYVEYFFLKTNYVSCYVSYKVKIDLSLNEYFQRKVLVDFIVFTSIGIKFSFFWICLFFLSSETIFVGDVKYFYLIENGYT